MVPYTATHAYQQECVSRCGALAGPVIMASPAHHCCAENLTEDEHLANRPFRNSFILSYLSYSLTCMKVWDH